MSSDKLRYNESNGLSEIDFAVVGVTFDNRQDILKRIYPEYLNHVKIPVRLDPEPANIYDPYAIKVVLPTTEEIIGYVSKDFNKEILPIVSKIKDAYVLNIYMNRTRSMGIIIKICYEG